MRAVSVIKLCLQGQVNAVLWEKERPKQSWWPGCNKFEERTHWSQLKKIPLKRVSSFKTEDIKLNGRPKKPWRSVMQEYRGILFIWTWKREVKFIDMGLEKGEGGDNWYELGKGRRIWLIWAWKREANFIDMSLEKGVENERGSNSAYGG